MIIRVGDFLLTQVQAFQIRHILSFTVMNIAAPEDILITGGTHALVISLQAYATENGYVTQDIFYGTELECQDEFLRVLVLLTPSSVEVTL